MPLVSEAVARAMAGPHPTDRSGWECSAAVVSRSFTARPRAHRLFAAEQGARLDFALQRYSYRRMSIRARLALLESLKGQPVTGL